MIDSLTIWRSLDDIDDFAHLHIWNDQYLPVHSLWAVESIELAPAPVAKDVADGVVY